MRRINALRSKVIQASYYPAILLVVITIAVSISLLFSVPRFAHMYEELGAPLTGLTEALLVLSSYFPLLVGVLIVAVTAGLFPRLVFPGIPAVAAAAPSGGGLRTSTIHAQPGRRAA